MITEYPTLVLMKLAHHVTHVRLVGAGWDNRAVVSCDTAAGDDLPI